MSAAEPRGDPRPVARLLAPPATWPRTGPGGAVTCPFATGWDGTDHRLAGGSPYTRGPGPPSLARRATACGGGQ